MPSSGTTMLSSSSLRFSYKEDATSRLNSSLPLLIVYPSAKSFHSLRHSSSAF